MAEDSVIIENNLTMADDSMIMENNLAIEDPVYVPGYPSPREYASYIVERIMLGAGVW